MKRKSATAALIATALAGNRGFTDPKLRVVKPASRWTIPAIERKMNELAARARIVNPLGLGEQLATFCASVVENVHTADWLKDRSAITFAAAMGDKEAIDMHAEIVRFTTSNLVVAAAQWLAFFESVSLGDADEPFIQSEIGQAISVDAIGADGGNITVRAQFERDQCPIPLNPIASAWFEYPLTDVYKGAAVMDIALANINVALDFADKINSLLGSYLIVGGTNSRLVETFVTTGPNLSRDYVPRDNVNTGNFPAGNLITLADNSATSPFRKEVFDAIEGYCQSWGSGVFADGDLAPVAIHIASKHATAFLPQVSLTSYNNPVTEQIFSGGKVISYAGRKWLVIADNTIDPNLGMAYVRTNKPIGYYFDKPSQSLVVQDNDSTLLLANKGRVAERRVHGFGMPRHFRCRTLGVRYKTPA